VFNREVAAESMPINTALTTELKYRLSSLETKYNFSALGDMEVSASVMEWLAFKAWDKAGS